MPCHWPWIAVRTAVLALLALLPHVAQSARAQDYPRQTIKLLVPFVAGGGVDVVARILAPPLSDELGQPIIIENRGGAGGMLGAAAIAQSPADGYSLLLGTGSTHGTNSAVYARLGYDPVRDFVPVIQVTQSPLLLLVPPGMPVNSVSELIALAKSRPAPLNYGSYGPGSINHLSTELLNAMAAIQTTHVPYRGSAPALIDLMGGRLDLTLDGISTSLGYVQAGSLKMLAVAGAKRTPLLPDVPTIAEAAVPGYDTSVWFGVFAPAGTPKPIVELLNTRTNKVLSLTSVKDGLGKLGIETVGGRPDALARRVEDEIAKWAKLVLEKNIRIAQ